MENGDEITLSDLCRRREKLCYDIQKRRLAQRNIPKAGNADKNITNHTYVSSESDIIENSDSEPTTRKRNKNLLVSNSSTSSNDDVLYTSTMSPLKSHSFFGCTSSPIASPAKDNPNKKIIIISQKVIKKARPKACNKDDYLKPVYETPFHTDAEQPPPPTTSGVLVESGAAVPSSSLACNKDDYLKPVYDTPFHADAEQPPPATSGIHEEPEAHIPGPSRASTYCFQESSHSEYSDSILQSSRQSQINYKNSRNQPKRAKKTKKSMFIDFVSEDEDVDFSAGSSDVWIGESVEESSDDNFEHKEDNKCIEKKKKKKSNKKKENKSFRSKGQVYKTRTGNEVPEKQMKNNPCVVGKCKRGCFAIGEERRTTLFNFFWSLDGQRRKDWLVRISQMKPVERKRTTTPLSRRLSSYVYHINDGEDHKIVCQKFLLYTLAISQKFLRYTLSNAKELMAGLDQRHRSAPAKYSDLVKASLKTFIEKLPAVPSHYTRKRTNKVYLPTELKNISNLHRIYLKELAETNQETVSESYFRKVFTEEYNISFHTPKKDKCSLCVKQEHNKNELNEKDQEALKIHLEEKEATYNRFKEHQQLPSLRKNTVVSSFDMQKVLNTPYGDAVTLYYSRKYPMFDFTIYDSCSQDVSCYLWGECDGRKGSNEIATCLYSYLKHQDQKGACHVLLYCDSCPGQNKNKIILSLLHYFLVKSTNIEVIQINYLLPGHTYMPVDSVHATIEREVKKITVWSPNQWPSYIEVARKQPKPYNVNVMEHSDFLDWNNIADATFTKSVLKIIRFREIRIATLKKKNLGEIYLRYSMKPDAATETITLFDQKVKKGRPKKGCKGKAKNINKEIDSADIGMEKITKLTPLQLYKHRLPISDKKYKDLKNLCEKGIIPKRFHNDFLSLPHGNSPDVLVETDEEDTEKEEE